MSPEVFDVIVLGAGPAGENVADRAVRGGLSAVVVESELAGGECSYWACMPSKALLRPVELLAAARRLESTAAAVTGELDVAAVLRRRDEATSNHDDAGQVSWIEGLPARFVRGHGRLTGARTVAVSGEVTSDDGSVAPITLEARHAVVVATGTRALVPPIDGLAEARPWTSREATNATSVPRRLVVTGGGVVACEMAFAMHGLGAEEVTVLVRGDRLLERMEPEASELVADAFEEAGIDVRFGVSVTAVRRDGTGPVTVTVGGGTEDDAEAGGDSTVEADEILVATGRTLNTADIGLDAVGLTPGDAIEVDDSLRATGVEDGWLYAVGDVNGRNLLTHMGKYQARVCGDVIVARAKGEADDGPALRASADAYGAPQVVFTDPEACAVGLTEAAARERGLNVRAVTYALGDVSGAYLQADGYTGTAKAVVDEDRRVLLGVTFVGPGVSDLLHAATIAVTAEVPLERLWHAVPAYPTVSEIWLRLLETYGL